MFFFALAAVLAVGSASADSGLHVRAFGTPDGVVDSYFRGASGGEQVYYSIGGLWLGVEAKAEYDSAFSVAAVPVTLDLGLGDNFWRRAGTTLGPNPSFGSLPLRYSAFFNTYGLGLQLLTVDLNFEHLVLISESTRTSTAVANPADQLTAAFGDLAVLLLGLKGHLGAGPDFK